MGKEERKRGRESSHRTTRGGGGDQFVLAPERGGGGCDPPRHAQEGRERKKEELCRSRMLREKIGEGKILLSAPFYAAKIVKEKDRRRGARPSLAYSVGRERKGGKEEAHKICLSSGIIGEETKRRKCPLSFSVSLRKRPKSGGGGRHLKLFSP